MYKNNIYSSFLKTSKLFCLFILLLSSLCCSKSRVRTGHETRSSVINKEITNKKTFKIGSYINICDCSNQNGRCNIELAKYLLADKGITISENIFPSDHSETCYSRSVTAAFQFLSFFHRIVEFIQNNQTHCLNFNQLIKDILNTDISFNDRKTQLHRFIASFYINKDRITGEYIFFNAFPMNFSNLVAFLSGKHFTIDVCKNFFARTATINDFFKYECEIICYDGEKYISISGHFGFIYDSKLKNSANNVFLSENNDFLLKIIFHSNRIHKYEIRFIYHPTYLTYKCELYLKDFLISCYDEDQEFYYCTFYSVTYKILGFMTYPYFLKQFFYIYFYDKYLLKIQEESETRIDFNELCKFLTDNVIEYGYIVFEKVE